MNEQDPFAPLRDEPPPPALRSRVRDDLRRRGLLRQRRQWRHPLLLAAAGALLFLAGAWTGAWTGARRDAGPSASPQFALLLYEPASFDSTRSHTELAREYGAWAEGLGARFVGGEALGEQRVLMPPGATTGDLGAQQPTGYFLIRAENWEAALALARACPHLRHGGVVAVRLIVT